ncbi:MAG TPA: non-homologous end-joining DNA ligase [Candidatus Angelobacter sp.]|nr:non-homologous end-joining DNA ligase [Candidatus Angelobacter sp.]
MPIHLNKAKFLEPMLLLPTLELPEGPRWTYEPKLDGYRALAFKTAGNVHLRSRNDKSFNGKYPRVVQALSGLPDETVIDGEVVALDEMGRPSFNALQNFRSASDRIFYYVFDVPFLAGHDLTFESLEKRRELLRQRVLPTLADPVRECPELKAKLVDVLQAVRAQQLEGLVAKNLDSAYESGKRSGAWRKMRLNQRRDFVIGGYTIGGDTFDAIIFGFYDGDRFIYVGRTRNGFSSIARADLRERFRSIQLTECPFVNLPETKAGRWGLGLTVEKMKACRWIRPELVAQFEFAEWTPDQHLRHSSFISLKESVNPRQVQRD